MDVGKASSLSQDPRANPIFPTLSARLPEPGRQQIRSNYKDPQTYNKLPLGRGRLVINHTKVVALTVHSVAIPANIGAGVETQTQSAIQEGPQASLPQQ